MAAGVYNFKVEQGIKYQFNAKYVDEAQNPIPLTGYVAAGSIKMKMSDPNPIANFDISINTTTSDITVILAADALDNVVLKSNNHSDYVSAVYDIILYNPSVANSEIRLLNGTINISPRITKVEVSAGV